MKKFILKEVDTNNEFIFPVTPGGYSVSTGKKYEVINMHNFGDVALAGNNELNTFNIECMFPSHNYPFNQPNTDIKPFNNVKKFEDWIKNSTLLRFVVSKTTINRLVKVSNITYGERDGTNDLYVTVTLQEIKQMKQEKKVMSNTGNNSRTTEKKRTATTHIVVKRDTLSAISLKYYNSIKYVDKLAAYNGIKNKHLIYIGQVIKIPESL